MLITLSRRFHCPPPRLRQAVGAVRGGEGSTVKHCHSSRLEQVTATWHHTRKVHLNSSIRSKLRFFLRPYTKEYLSSLLQVDNCAQVSRKRESTCSMFPVLLRSPENSRINDGR
ncbi:hypothetical protein PFLUV_G00177810 [Perca fluviatilis]|uniref:Uncharacterized protein n=1 Tax=Perca fluviatilis TaxID=8168 RepID=A0A6A5EKV2_PERFL|nr:hypothetical protein PFLUV_G00177810 [Perca fluviatilis]